MDCAPDIVSFSSGVSALRNSRVHSELSGAASWTRAVETVSEIMSSRRIQADLICVNSLIAACEKVCRWQSAAMVQSVFTERGLSMDSTGYGALISSSKAEGTSVWRVALTWLLESVQRSFAANQICYNSCVDACEKGGQWQKALLLLERIPPLLVDEVSFTCGIRACQGWEEAAEILSSMRTLRIFPNLRSYSAMFSCEQQNWSAATEFWRDMSTRGLKTNEVASNAFLKTSEKRNWERATALLIAMPSAGLKPTSPGIHSCLAACQPGCWPVVSQMLKRVQSMMMQGNVDSFSAVMSAYEKSILWEDALNVWLGLFSKNLKPDIVCFNAMTSAFARGFCWKLAMELFGRIRCTISADFITRNAILTSCSGVRSWQIALFFFDGAQWSRLPDMEAHSVMIASCTTSFQWRLGLSLLERMDSAQTAFAALAVAITSSLEGCFGDARSEGCDAGSLQQVPQLFFLLEDSATLACTALNPCSKLRKGGKVEQMS
eukprot:Skav201533  [mRNA]  locus=scaffold1616:70063:71538:+ [translate_table: standard]